MLKTLMLIWAGLFAHVELAAADVAAGDPQLEAYVDGVIGKAMQEKAVAGLTLSIVRDGKVVLSKGYGYANVESKVPVDPGFHMFRIGSTTKTFTFASVMKLVGEGKLDLDADVNTYLTKFKIPEAFGKPITLRDLVSHRPGFEEAYRDLFVRDETTYTDLETWLAGNIPARVFAPGEVTSYSNYGAALAGYIVQITSGMTWEEYLEATFFKPLGMVHTTAKQPVRAGHPSHISDSMLANVAQTYSSAGGALKAAPFELVLAAPAGSISSTADDMARYMLMYLGGGMLDGSRVLSEAIVAQLQTRPYPGREGPGYMHGFRTNEMLGYTTFEHGGATGTSFTNMLMVPELGIGIFASTNGSGISRTVHDPSELIMQYLIGDAAKAVPARITLSEAEAAKFAGSYMTTRRIYSKFAKAFSLSGSLTAVAPTGNGTLVIASGGKAAEYYRIKDASFRNHVTGDVVAFELDSDGIANRIYSTYGHAASDRVTSSTSATSLYTAFAILVAAGLLQLSSAWRRRGSGAVEVGISRWLNFGTMAAAITGLVTLLFFGLTILKLGALGRDALSLWPFTEVYVFSVLGLVMLAFAVAGMIGLYPLFAKTNFTTARKIHCALFALVLVNFVVKLNHWNMIGFNFI